MSGQTKAEVESEIRLVPQNNSVKIMSDDAGKDAEAENSVLPPPGQDRDFESAIHDFRRVLPSDGEIDGTEDDLDRSEQFQRIESEAQRLGYLYDGLGPQVEGGREHDLIYDEVTGSVLKFTKPSSAAFVVEILDGRPRLCNGDPIEYLERIALHEEIFGLGSSFVGIWRGEKQSPDHHSTGSRQRETRMVARYYQNDGQ